MRASRPYANMCSMGNAGSDQTWFKRNLDGAIRRRDYSSICLYAPAVEHKSLYTKAAILDVMRTEAQDHFDKAAGKFIADYIAERQPGRTEIDELVNWTDPIMFALEPLLERCDPRRYSRRRRAT
jgi:hypothetical protein